MSIRWQPGPTLAICAIAAMLSASPLSAGDDRAGLNAAYRTLSMIRSPYDMLARHLPARYTVPVTLSGPIADEITTSLGALKINSPAFEETFDGTGHFRLALKGSNVDSRTREMLSGILNPAEMTEAILGSVLRYREAASLLRMQQETHATMTSRKCGDTVLQTITLKPQGNRFSYTHSDMGSCITESWLTELSVTIDSSRHLVREVALLKTTRIAGDGENGTHSSFQRFIIGYSGTKGSELPARLDLVVNYRPTLTITAQYRPEKSFFVLDKRVMTCILPDGSESHLSTDYGAYRFELALGRNDRPESGATLAEAAAYARKAAAAMTKGDIGRAVAIYRTIERSYPGTPQAVEARRLLSGIPKDF